MATHKDIQSIKKKFGSAILLASEFLGETTLEVHKNYLKEVLSYCKQFPDPGYEGLIDLTAVDYLEPMKRTKIIYLLLHPVSFERLKVIIYVSRGEAVPSVIDLWEGANWYERELYDLFGIIFENHPDLTRLLMPDDWEGHPLQRDYPLTEEVVAFKHGVKPKTPSEIIDVKKKQRSYPV